MKFLPLLWRNIFRRKFRTTFTVGCIFISFVLYAFLMIVRTAFSQGVDFAGVDLADLAQAQGGVVGPDRGIFAG